VKPLRLTAIICLVCTLSVASSRPALVDPGFVRNLKRIQHVIVIYQENWSFDGLYGSFPGANGIANAQAASVQVDRSGNPLAVLPQPLDSSGKPDPRFPMELPAVPFDLAKYVPPDQISGDMIHRFYHEQLQIDGGRMDKFVAWSDNGALTLSHFDAVSILEGRIAKEFVLCDNFFHSAFGGSFLNHQFLIAAAPPRWANAPADLVSNPDPQHLVDATVTPDGFAVNTAYSVNTPRPKDANDPTHLLPEQTNPTIGDRLTEKHVSWKWYSGGWNDALAGHPDLDFQYHHQPFAYYKNFRDGTAARAKHLQDETRFTSDLLSGALPAVSFIKPLGRDNEHPGYANLLQGQKHVAEIVAAVRDSEVWKSTLIIITYDENGGRWDHVAPPAIDRWGPGTRVPTIIVSPFAKRGFVDHTQYETVSILRLLELRFGLAPLSSRDANVDPLTNAFDFVSK
jgi:phospholipase C